MMYRTDLIDAVKRFFGSVTGSCFHVNVSHPLRGTQTCLDCTAKRDYRPDMTTGPWMSAENYEWHRLMVQVLPTRRSTSSRAERNSPISS